MIKEDHRKKLVKDIKVCLKKKKNKSNNIVMNDTKMYQKMKNKSLLSMEKNIMKQEKMSYYNYKELILFFKNL